MDKIKLWLLFLSLGLLSTCTKLPILGETTTTVMLVRHAETTGSGSARNLSEIGQKRAAELAQALKDIPIKAVYSTNYNRTMQTAAPIAEQKGLSVQSYNPSNLGGFADDLLAKHKGETVLVVGHSNTTPALTNVLVGANTYENFPETEYDNLFIATVVEKGNAQVILLKYGE